jgi:hypothetical protein
MVSSLPEVIHSLQDPRSYPHPTTRIKLIQTQMSLVFLTGRYVYKLKKPVNLGYWIIQRWKSVVSSASRKSGLIEGSVRRCISV